MVQLIIFALGYLLGGFTALLLLGLTLTAQRESRPPIRPATLEDHSSARHEQQ
jgi:hypothetical protein